MVVYSGDAVFISFPAFLWGTLYILDCFLSIASYGDQALNPYGTWYKPAQC